MAALDDGLYDVGGEICEPQEPADMRFAEAMALRNSQLACPFDASIPANFVNSPVPAASSPRTIASMRS